VEAPVAPVGKSNPLTEIEVTLFGQPCLMNGPFPRPTLVLIHEVSPERVPPNASVEQMKKIRAKVLELKNVPMPIEQYREHLRKRLSAKIAFEEALGPAKKQAKGPAESRKALASFLKNLKEHISTLQYAGFEESAKKSLEANQFAWNPTFIEPLREKYEEVIQPETQEEFHKAIRLSKIQYVCTFDDAHADHGSEEAAED
jgi:hypothetical protein